VQSKTTLIAVFSSLRFGVRSVLLGEAHAEAQRSQRKKSFCYVRDRLAKGGVWLGIVQSKTTLIAVFSSLRFGVRSVLLEEAHAEPQRSQRKKDAFDGWSYLSSIDEDELICQ
jgi:hypothetical protein